MTINPGTRLGHTPELTHVYILILATVHSYLGSIRTYTV